MTDMKQVRGQVEGSLSNAGKIIKVVQIGLLVLGGVLALWGIVGLVSGSAGGVGQLISGAVCVAVALFFLPRFSHMISGMTSQVMPALNQLEQNQALLQNGLDGQAEVVNLQETGQYINNQPQVQIALQVTHPNGQQYQTTTLAMVPQTAIPRVQPGSQIPVKIDPSDQNKVAVVL